MARPSATASFLRHAPRSTPLGRVLARSLVARITGERLEQIDIDAAPSGALRSTLSGMHLSIAHSGPWIVAAAGGRPVGIDVQIPIRVVPRRALTDEEARWVNGLPAERRALEAARLWAIKEARAKLSGDGLRFPLPGIAVPPGQVGAGSGVHWRTFGTEEVAGALATESSEDLPSGITIVKLDDPDRWVAA